MVQVFPAWFQVATGGTTYVGLFVPKTLNNNSTAVRANTPVPVAGTLQNLRVRKVGSTTASGSVTLMKNGSATTLTVTISNITPDVSDTTHAISVVAGDLLCWQVTLASGSNFAVQSCVEWTATTGNTAIHVTGTDASLFDTATRYLGLLYGDLDSGAYSSLNTTCPWNFVAVPGTITTMYINRSVAPGVGTTCVATIFLNGVAQDGTAGTPDTRVTISGTATTGSASFSLPVVAGDAMAWRYVATVGAPASGYMHTTVALVAATPDWSMGCCAGQSFPTGVANYFNGFGCGETGGGQTNPPTVEAENEMILSVAPLRLSNMRVRIPTAPGTSKSHTVTFRSNQAASAMLTSLSGATVDATATGLSVVLTAADRFCVQSTPSGTPAASGGFRLSYQATSSLTLALSPSTLPNGLEGTAYSQQLTASGGAPPYTYTIGAGSLPLGLSLSSSGLISGTPTTPQLGSFTVHVVDSA